jgi:DNA-binding MarR family transcriptional regulator
MNEQAKLPATDEPATDEPATDEPATDEPAIVEIDAPGGSQEPARADDILRLDKQVCFALYAASNLMVGFYRPTLTGLGLTFPQYLVMLSLWEKSPQSVGSIGQQLYLDTGTLTPLLKRMEVAGLLTRQRDVNDERRVFIALTEQGISLRASALHAIEELAKTTSLSEAEAELLRDGAHNMIAALKRCEAKALNSK